LVVWATAVLPKPDGTLTAAPRGVLAPRSNDADGGAADLGLHFVEQLLVGGTALVKRRSSRGVGLENALDDDRRASR